MKVTTQQIAHRFGSVLIVLALIASFLLIFVFNDEDAANANNTQPESNALSAQLTPLVAQVAPQALKATKKPAQKSAVARKTSVRVKTTVPKAKAVGSADGTSARVTITKPKPTVKKPHVTRVPISQWATTDDMQRKLDRCIGPVAITIPDAPLLIAEHDYCGGAARIASRRMGDRVHVTSGGGVNGTYKVVSIRRVPKGSSTSVLRGLGAVVLQTCVGNAVVLVGINRV